MSRDRLAFLGERVRRLREKKGWTQGQLAEAIRVTQPAVAHVEAGRREPSLAVLRDLARALGTTTDELLRDAGPGEMLAASPPGQPETRKPSRRGRKPRQEGEQR